MQRNWSRVVLAAILLAACSDGETIGGVWRGIASKGFEGGAGFRACGSNEYWMVLGSFRPPAEAWVGLPNEEGKSTAVVIRGRVSKTGSEGITVVTPYERVLWVDRTLVATSDTTGWCRG